MFRYIVRRTLYAIPVLLAILVVTFMLARMIPGDPCTAMLGEKATQEACERFNQRFGLDRPLPVQLVVYMGNIFRGDLGDSIRFGRPIALMLSERLPVTIELGMTAMFLAVAIGVPAGLVSALRRNSGIDVSDHDRGQHRCIDPCFCAGAVVDLCLCRAVARYALCPAAFRASLSRRLIGALLRSLRLECHAGDARLYPDCDLSPICTFSIQLLP